MRRAKEVDGYQLTVDLETLRGRRRPRIRGHLREWTESPCYCPPNGLDDIGLTLQQEAQIAAYETKHPVAAEMKTIATIL